jgi:hypothetical protein
VCPMRVCVPCVPRWCGGYETNVHKVLAASSRLTLFWDAAPLAICGRMSMASQTNEDVGMADPIRRRRVIGVSAAVVTLGVLRGSPPDAERDTSLDPVIRRSGGSACADHALRQPDLFVFRGCGAGNLVVAVIAPAVTGRYASRVRFDVRVHAGSRCWAVDDILPLQSGVLSERADCRIFAGEVLGPATAVGARHTAVVIESRLGGGEDVAVWAEIGDADGVRLRVGTPFIAALLAGDPMLSGRYHAASPTDDRMLFSDAIASRVRRLAAARGVHGSDARVARLVERLLPDVIRYHPDLPVGFSFAGQNGRHPADDAAAVVETILTGTVASRTAARQAGLTGSFPYFAQPGFL